MKLNFPASFAAIGASLLGLSAQVMAAVPTGAEGVFTTAADDAKAILGFAFTCMAAVVGGFVVMKLVKRAVKSAT